MNKQYYSNIQLAAGLTNEQYAEVIGFWWVLKCFLEITRKRPAMAWETGFRSMIPLRVSTLLFLKVVGLAVGHKNPAGYTYTQRTTCLRT